MTKEELEKLFLWSEKHGIAYTDGCLLSLNLDKLIKDKALKYQISPHPDSKVFGVFTINRHERSLSLEDNKVFACHPNPLVPTEWLTIRDIYFFGFVMTSRKEQEFLSKTFLSDITDFRFENKYQGARNLYHSKYEKQKQVGDTIMYYNDFGTGEVRTVIMYLEGFEKNYFFGPSIHIKKNIYPKYIERNYVDEIFSSYFTRIGKTETLTISNQKLTPKELKELNSVEGRTSCVKCKGQLKHIEGFMNNYSYCPKCE